MTEPTMTKMTFKVHAQLWESFDAQIRTLPIKRDPFLANLIRCETPRLAKAMAGKQLSGTANRWISTQLNRLRPVTVNIGIEKEVVAALKEVVVESNMVRDAFINRILAFVRSSDALLDHFGLPHREDGKVGKNYGKDILKPVSPMSSLVEVFADPLWYLHVAIQEICEDDLYLLPFPSPLMGGFACWMDDADVPGTQKHRRTQRELAEIFKDIAEFELDAFSPTRKGG